MFRETSKDSDVYDSPSRSFNIVLSLSPSISSSTLGLGYKRKLRRSRNVFLPHTPHLLDVLLFSGLDSDLLVNTNIMHPDVPTKNESPAAIMVRRRRRRQVHCFKTMDCN